MAAEDTIATQQLLDRLRAGDRTALDGLLERYRERMRRFLDLRMDGKLRGRVDPSDIIQEAQIEMARRIDDYLNRTPMPFHVWVCKTSYENLLRLRRQHVEAARRSVEREAVLSQESSVMLAGKMLAGTNTPSQQLIREELVKRVQDAMGELSEVDREILLLRTFEGLSNVEVAQVLDLQPEAASKRYGRALIRLRQVLAEGESA